MELFKLNSCPRKAECIIPYIYYLFEHLLQKRYYRLTLLSFEMIKT
jgi:hypothetical protein